MSDLISRSKVISILEQLEEHSMSGQMYISNAIYLLKNRPTAYDIDKVVEELEKIEQHCLDMSDWQGQSAICDAIEIVKQGIVSDDVCEWKKSKDYPFDWLVGYDGCEVNHRQGDYCPRCGKKIKVVE